MPTDVIMPALGMAQETGRLLAWRKAEGEAVVQGEPLFEVETDKVTVEIEAPASGVLTWVRAMAGDDVPVGQPIALILSPAEVEETTGEPAPVPLPRPVPDKAPAPAAAEDATGEPAPVPLPRPVPDKAPAPAAAEDATGEPAPVPLPRPVPDKAPAAEEAQIVASPVAQRIAAEHGVDLRAVRPNGGRVLKEDVLAYLQHRQARLEPASPKARRLAAERGIALGAVRGSGPEGAVLAADVLAFQASASPGRPTAAPGHGVAGPAPGPRPAFDNRPQTADDRRKPALPSSVVDRHSPESAPALRPSPASPAEGDVSAAWRVMAERLSQSWTTVPHFYLVREVEATGLLAWQRQARDRSAHKVTLSDALVLLVATALRAHPHLNGGWADGRMVRNERVNIGLAVAVEEGLLVPVIHDADRLRLGQLAERRADLVARTQARQLRPDDLRDGTFTISNLGMFGVDAFNAIVNPPQAAILAVGRVAERVVPVAGQPAVRPMLTLTLSCDHRAVDGARAARFLEALAGLVEDPLRALE